MPMQTAESSRSTRGGNLHRITVNLTPRSAAALTEACSLTGDTKTDTINRALQVYAYLQAAIEKGGSLYVRPDEDSELEKLHFI